MKQFAQVYEKDLLVKQDYFEVIPVEQDLIFSYDSNCLFHLFQGKENIFYVKYNYYDLFETYETYSVVMCINTNVTYI